ncbi:MAG: FAD-binding dehydrogenase [Acidobacteria bacterium]|nr:FAD-binding dehydrogenase [Acidobacteriota bacterium]
MHFDVLIAGGGLAGLAAALEALDRDLNVCLVERGPREELGGLARKSFGGVTMIDTPLQRRSGIRDNPETALEDWYSYAEFDDDAQWPKAWAEVYCQHSVTDIYEWLTQRNVRFMPLVNWPERGLDRLGNRLPRWHITWGTGQRLVGCLVDALDRHPKKVHLTCLYSHKVTGFLFEGDRVLGIQGEHDGTPFEKSAQHVVVASGGICGGDLSLVRKHWEPSWGEPPKNLLNGSHKFADGLLHQSVAELGGQLTHLQKQWHYAAGVHHPRPKLQAHGLSLVPPRSALWCDATGKRFGPRPLVAYTDTRHLVKTICQSPAQYSWLVMNWRIAAKELAVSGTEYMTAFTDQDRILLLKNLIFGNHELVKRLTDECEDFVVANDLEALAGGMNDKSLDGFRVDSKALTQSVTNYDRAIARGRKYVTDEQLMRIDAFRRYRGDRIRTCNWQPINHPKAKPLIAIRCFILARKSLGGMQTDLHSRVLDRDGTPIQGLYAVGEAAGFGGGGIHGKRALEGTFLGACVLTGRRAIRAICGGLS